MLTVPPQSVPTLRYTRRHGSIYTAPCPQALTESSPLDFRRSSIKQQQQQKMNYKNRLFQSLSNGTDLGKIQGDGRKFLDRFKSYFGSRISSQSLNEVHIYRLQQNSAAKDDLFHIFLSLIVSNWRHGLQMANEADEVLLGKRPR